MKPLRELVDADEPALPMVREWIAASRRPVEVLPRAPADGERALLGLQVTTRSPMGALAYETGGLLVDDGWLRVLGAGHPRLPRSLDRWNGLPDGPARLPGALLVGDDAVGGFFAINGGALPGPRGHVFYLAPDTLAWEDTEGGYSDWLRWALAGDLATYYDNARWRGWEADAAQLAGDRAFLVYPFLFAGGPPVDERSRKPVPVEELWQLHAVELPGQLG